MKIDVENYIFIDAGKFIAMFFVVCMHTIRDNSNTYFKLFQIGCMAYFFFASGFLFKEKENSKIFDYIAKNFRALLVPYFLFSVIGLIFVYYFPDWYPSTPKELCENIFIKGQPTAFSLVWFILCLFEVKIIFMFIWKLIKHINNKMIITIVLLILIIVFNKITLDILDFYKAGGQRLPLKFDCTMVAITFYILGFLFRFLGIFKIFEKYWFSILVLLLSRLFVHYIEINLLGITNIFDFRFENSYFYYYLNQILGIISFISLGNILSFIKPICFIGRNNKYIYLLHNHLLWGVEEILGIFTGVVHYSFYNLSEIFFVAGISYIVSITVGLIVANFIRKLRKCWKRI